jgi:hypothetical protein
MTSKRTPGECDGCKWWSELCAMLIGCGTTVFRVENIPIESQDGPAHVGMFMRSRSCQHPPKMNRFV